MWLIMITLKSHSVELKVKSCHFNELLVSEKTTLKESIHMKLWLRRVCMFKKLLFLNLIDSSLSFE